MALVAYDQGHRRIVAFPANCMPQGELGPGAVDNDGVLIRAHAAFMRVGDGLDRVLADAEAAGVPVILVHGDGGRGAVDAGVLHPELHPCHRRSHFDLPVRPNGSVFPLGLTGFGLEFEKGARRRGVAKGEDGITVIRHYKVELAVRALGLRRKACACHSNQPHLVKGPGLYRVIVVEFRARHAHVSGVKVHLERCRVVGLRQPAIEVEFDPVHADVVGRSGGELEGEIVAGGGKERDVGRDAVRQGNGPEKVAIAEDGVAAAVLRLNSIVVGGRWYQTGQVEGVALRECGIALLPLVLTSLTAILCQTVAVLVGGPGDGGRCGRDARRRRP